MGGPVAHASLPGIDRSGIPAQDHHGARLTGARSLWFKILPTGGKVTFVLFNKENPAPAAFDEVLGMQVVLDAVKPLIT